MNRRVGRKVGGTLVQGLLYENQLSAVAELDGAGNLVAQYVYGTKSNVPDVKTDGSGTYRILSDHLGSPRLVVNTADGTVVERMDFDEWGNVTADSSPDATPFGFAGGLYDQTTGAMRFGARDYDPTSGRWMNKDPIRFGGGQANIYEYSHDEPVNNADQSGLDSSNSCSTIRCCNPGDNPTEDNCIKCSDTIFCTYTGPDDGKCQDSSYITCTYECDDGSTGVPKRQNVDACRRQPSVDASKTCHKNVVK